MSQNLSSAAVVIGALRVKKVYSTTKETHQSLLNAIIENRIKK